MDREGISAFCSMDVCREDLHEPFSTSRYTYASTGHLAIRVDRINGVRDDDGDRATRLDAAIDRDPVRWLQVPDLCKTSHRCGDCGGAGHMYECDECDGGGFLTFFGKYDDYEVVCEHCQGDGVVEPADRRDATKKVPCGRCLGTGITSHYEHEFCRVGDVVVQTQYIDRFAHLPGVEISQACANKDDSSMVLVRFDGGRGVIVGFLWTEEMSAPLEIEATP